MQKGKQRFFENHDLPADAVRRKLSAFAVSVCGFPGDIQNLCHFVEIQKRNSAVQQICDIWHKTSSFPQ
jgi:hypothetical protein